VTRADDAIGLQGTSTAIKRVTLGAVDGHGDPAETWATTATEDAVIKPVGAKRRSTQAGQVDESDYVGIFLSTSVVQVGDVLEVGSAKYEVLGPVITKTIHGSTSHLEAPLRVLQEG
jgi:hypothetical protein